MILNLLLITAATAYLTFSLRMDINHKGPGVFSAFVRDVNGELRPVGAFDWIRRLFGAYRVVDNPDAKNFEAPLWHISVQPHQSAWFCVFCLSFWTQIPLFLYDMLVLHSLDLSFYPYLMLVVPLIAGVLNLAVDWLIESANSNE